MTILYRSASLSSGNGRTVHGIAVPFGQVAEIFEDGRTYQERFQQGAFARSIRERGSKVKLLTNHDARRLPVGRAVELEERPDGLHASFEVAQTRDGDDALELVRSGTVDAFSVGFRGLRHRMDGDVVVRTEASLWEVSLVAFPAYPGAAVAGVRSQLVISRAIAERRLRLLDL
ncbi:HK97 family phage prohead protease [Nocardia sp. CA-120079]|uniref:HK97 family phage prohead protease n=1 Tax=Nocardia sp. CA-120079 TaxID=3239974 RepID=UPI003D96382F